MPVRRRYLCFAANVCSENKRLYYKEQGCEGLSRKEVGLVKPGLIAHVRQTRKARMAFIYLYDVCFSLSVPE